MYDWRLADDVKIRPLHLDDGDALHALIDDNRAHLDCWLRWSSGVRTRADVDAFIAMFARKRADGDGFHSGIWWRGALAGGVVCWYVHRHHRNAEVGYWLGERFTGHGLATRAAARAIEHLFDAEGPRGPPSRSPDRSPSAATRAR